MTADAYPEMIIRLPEADVPVPGIRGWLLQGTDRQVVFFDIEPTAKIPPHSHGEQWGIVVSGEMDLTIGGETRHCRPGASYFIPAGVEHYATFRSRVRAIDVFADRNRYQRRT
jgi:quercetin dioxygenase-like cupin family protein